MRTSVDFPLLRIVRIHLITNTFRASDQVSTLFYVMSLKWHLKLLSHPPEANQLRNNEMIHPCISSIAVTGESIRLQPQNAPVPYPQCTISYHKCACVHISVTKWCIVVHVYTSTALGDCKMDLWDAQDNTNLRSWSTESIMTKILPMLFLNAISNSNPWYFFLTEWSFNEGNETEQTSSIPWWRHQMETFSA